MYRCTRFTAVIAVCTLFCLAGTAPAARGDRVSFARDLSLSPNGAALAFRWAGDIWTAPAVGGMATRLTVHRADESRPVWSPDGKRIAYASGRSGSNCVYVMDADGDNVRRLTWGDRSELPTSWSPDGKFVYFQARKEGQVIWEPATYKVSIDGGQPIRAFEAYGADGRVSPDGRRIAFTRGASRWWRKNYRGSANHDIWIFDTAADSFRRVTDFDGTDRSPQWAPDGATIYYISDRDGRGNVWEQKLDGNTRQLTRMKTDDVRDLTVAADGRTLAFTHWDQLYVMDLPNGTPKRVDIRTPADNAWNTLDPETMTRGADEIEVSPDGKELALVVRGEIFVIPTAEDQPTRRVTHSPYRDRHVSWTPDGKALYFISDRDGHEAVYRAMSAEEPAKTLSESLQFDVVRVTSSDEMERAPIVSPDGRLLAFTRARGDLWLRELKTGTERRVVAGYNFPDYAWSPDSKWLAYAIEDAEYNPDVWIVPAEGDGAAVNISRHPDADFGPRWSADGQMLAFSSRREGFDSDLYLVFLSPALDQKSSAGFAEYFEQREKQTGKRKPLKTCDASDDIPRHGYTPPPVEEKDATADDGEADDDENAEDEEDGKKKRKKRRRKNGNGDDGDNGNGDDEDEAEEEVFEYDLESAWRRLRRVTSLAGDQGNFTLHPAGKVLIFSSSHEGETNLHQIEWNGREEKRIRSGGHGALQWAFNGKRLFFNRSGRPGSCKLGGGDAKTHGFRARMTIDHLAEAAQKFDDAARQLGLRFYHTTLKGLDWPELSARYRALALQTRSHSEFNDVFNMLQGELNGSHLGMSGPSSGIEGEPVGYLGVTFDAAHPGPGLKVASVLAEGPADRNESRLFPGDILLTVNRHDVGPASPIERALINTVGDEVLLAVTPSAARIAYEQEQAEKRAAQAAEKKKNDKEHEEDDDEAEDEDTAEADPNRTRMLRIRSIAFGAFNNLRYRAWVDANRRYVEAQTDGRIGYTHIRAMAEGAFYNFERDLYAAAHGKDGLIIDVRNNGGGWTADWVMAVLSVKRHAFTIGRGGERGYPQGRLIFYAWTKPATMMCNQYSYSNAEIVSHAFKNLGRGTLVGMPTFGAVISTGAYGLIDGSRIRMPFRGWYTLPHEVDMENNGAVPNVIVDRTPADEAADRYPQLDAAIEATRAKIRKQQ